MTDKTQTERAFPWCGDLNEAPTINLGMTLRDYFAAKAMQGYCAREDSINSCFDDIASDAYAIADSMLKEREQQ